MTIPNGHCERARRWASLRVDDELSELEAALLDAHLERCPACLAFARGLDGVGALLRSAPLEQPSAPIRVRALRTGRPLRILQASAAVAVVATAGLGAMVVDVFHSTSEHAAPPRIARISAVGNDSPSTARDLRRDFLAVGEPRSVGHVVF